MPVSVNESGQSTFINQNELTNCQLSGNGFAADIFWHLIERDLLLLGYLMLPHGEREVVVGTDNYIRVDHIPKEGHTLWVFAQAQYRNWLAFFSRCAFGDKLCAAAVAAGLKKPRQQKRWTPFSSASVSDFRNNLVRSVWKCLTGGNRPGKPADYGGNSAYLIGDNLVLRWAINQNKT